MPYFCPACRQPSFAVALSVEMGPDGKSDEVTAARRLREGGQALLQRL